MLLHLRPRCYCSTADAYLVDFEIPQLDLRLRSGRDLTTSKPYPNKKFNVGSRKVPGRKAVDGLLISTSQELREFTTISHWQFGEGRVAKHTIDYKLVDDDFDTVTDNMVYWSALKGSLGDWANRWPVDVQGPPSAAQPRMEFYADDRAPRIGDVRDTINMHDQITHRHETFWMPTIEPERLAMFRTMDRVPANEHTFVA